MGFRKRVNISDNYNNKATRPRSSNPGIQTPDDGHKNSMTGHLVYSTEKNVGSRMHMDTSRQQNVIFKRNMLSKKVQLELFIIEGSENFENRSLRSKMTEVIKYCDEDLKMYYFEKGVDDDLPKSWEEFKIFIVEYCTETGINSLKKYNDEPWSAYVNRLKDYGKYKNIECECILKKIRSEFIPRNLQPIFFSVGVDINTILERLLEIETFEKRKRKEFRTNLVRNKDQYKKK
jgi:hypothetical protein